ncbi:MAG: DUF484 family protein [Betaproteobacteria bacterium]|nr:DUF484 family protein [Betaproteobacteria bacterium]
MGVQGITEADIANYLAHTPGFFERQAELLATIRLASPHGTRAVSLQERQMEMLRERIKGLEHKIIEMIRAGQENVAIADRLHRWTRSLMLTADPSELPGVLVTQVQQQFLVPQAAVRVWDVAEAFAGLAAAQGVSEEARSLAQSLSLPFCGLNTGGDVVKWLDDAHTVASMAMIPLRHGSGDGCFGLLVLGSPDPTRYAADMGTDFLMRMGELASAAMARLLPTPQA